MEGIIPDNKIYRKKQGFSAPVKEWFKGELGDYMSDAIMRSRICEHRFFNYDCISRMITQQKEVNADNSARLCEVVPISRTG